MACDIRARVKLLRVQQAELERRQREAIIAEFTAEETEATMHAMAAEILRQRKAIARLAAAIALVQAGSSFALIRPGPYCGTSDSVKDIPRQRGRKSAVA